MSTPHKDTSISTYLREAIERLKNAGVDNPQLDARLLFCHALGIDRTDLLSQSERILSAHEASSINALIARREKRESVARIIGKREFWGLDFALNEATLEPRPDSETVIEAIISSCPQRRASHLLSCSNQSELAPQDTKENFKILDLGTGTGCLLLALLHEFPQATGIGIDINPRATEQAQTNAQSLGLGSRAEFRAGSWLKNITEKFDIIVSNPPYIPANEIPHLMREVREYDPVLALDGGEDGLAPYRYLIPQLKDFMKPNGIAAFEVGQGQAQQVADLFRQNCFNNTSVHKDLGGIDRCVMTVFTE